MVDDLGGVTQKGTIDWKRTFFLSLGILLFALVYYAPPMGRCYRPHGTAFYVNQGRKGGAGSIPVGRDLVGL